MQLRPYQSEAIAAVRNELATSSKTFIAIPTGGGKTLVAAHIIKQEKEAQPHTKFLVLQHREELIEQNKRTVDAVTGLATSVVKGDLNDWSGDVVFASVQSAHGSRLASSPIFSHIIIDEAHRAHAKSYQAIIDHNAGAKVLGLTATPDRKTVGAFGLPAFSIAIGASDP